MSSYFGGKFEMAAKFIEPHYPAHQTFVDLFGGMAGATLTKRPSPIEVYNDINPDLVAMFRAIRECPDDLARACEFTPWSRDEWLRCSRSLRSQRRVSDAARDALKLLPEGPEKAALVQALQENQPGDIETDELIERARRFIVKARQSMSGAPGRAWQLVVTHSRRQMASTCSSWMNLPQAIAEIAVRMRLVQIECGEYDRILDTYDHESGSTLFYVDPPYHPETCQVGVYPEAGGKDMDAAGHAVLLRRLNRLHGSVVLSGYDHPFYDKWLVQRWGWDRIAFTVACRSNVKANGDVAGKPTREEVLWVKRSEYAKNSRSSLFDPEETV